MQTQVQLAPQVSAIARKISDARLGPYLAQTGGHYRNALRLYRWNIELSGAAYEVLHIFEIVLRNSIDEQLRAWNGTQRDRRTGRLHSGDWLLDPAHLLVRLVQERKLQEARDRAQKAIERSAQRTRAMTHGDVLAQLTLGTWRYLLPSRDAGRRRLWSDAVSNAFPYLTRAPAELVSDVENVHLLRNRVAHLEPLLSSGAVESEVTAMRRVLLEIDPSAEQWLVSQQRVTAVLNRRP